MLEIKQFNPTTNKIKALVYGASGIGKTSFAGEATNALFASAEGGLLSIRSKKPNYVTIKSLKNLEELYVYLSTTPDHPYETLVIDSITEINEVIKNEIEINNKRAMQLQDWGVLSKKIKTILRNFRDLADEPKKEDKKTWKPINVLFIAQEMSDEKDENGVASKIVPSLNGKNATEIAYFMDIVGYIFINKSGERKLTTSSHPKLLTKDRTGLIGDDTELSFQAWIEKAKQVVKEEEKVVVTVQTVTTTPAKKVAPATQPATPAPLAPMTDAEVDASIEKIKTMDNKKIYEQAKKVGTSARLNDAQKKKMLDAMASKIYMTEADFSDYENIFSPFPPEPTAEEVEGVIEL